MNFTVEINQLKTATKTLTKCIDESQGKSLKSLYKYIKEGKSGLNLSIIGNK